MKFGIIPALLCCCLLAGCSMEKEITGEIIEVQLHEDTGTETYVIRTEKGDTVALTAGSATAVSSWVDGIDAQGLRSGGYTGVIASAAYNRTGSATVRTKDGMEVKAYTAVNLVVEERVTREAYTLSDGTELTRRDTIFDRFSYVLPDGTELLWGERPDPADGLSIGNLDSRSDLSEDAKAAIASYLDGESASFDIGTSLEAAYRDHLNAKETGREFRSHIFLRENWLPGGNEHYVTCATSLSLPVDQYYTGIAEEIRRFVIFDTKTGEEVPLWSLFQGSEQQARMLLGEHCIADNADTTAEEYAAAIDPAYTCWTPGGIELYFPAGSLREYEHTLIVTVDGEELEAVLTEEARSGND